MSPPCGHVWNHTPWPPAGLTRSSCWGNAEGIVFSRSVQLVKGRPETGERTPKLPLSFAVPLPVHPLDDIVLRKNKPPKPQFLPNLEFPYFIPNSSSPCLDFPARTSAARGKHSQPAHGWGNRSGLRQGGSHINSPPPTGSLEAIAGMSSSSTNSGRWPFRAFSLPGSERTLIFWKML